MGGRFDVVAAYHLVASRWHSGQGSKGYAVLSRCVRLGYRPGLTAETRKGSDERNAAARLLWARRREVVRTW